MNRAAHKERVGLINSCRRNERFCNCRLCKFSTRSALRVAATISIVSALLAINAVWHGSKSGAEEFSGDKIHLKEKRSFELRNDSIERNPTPESTRIPSLLMHRDLAKSGCLFDLEYFQNIVDILEGASLILIDPNVAQCLARFKNGLPQIQPALMRAGNNLGSMKAELFKEEPQSPKCIRLGITEKDFLIVQNMKPSYSETIWKKVFKNMDANNILLKSGHHETHVLLTKIIHGKDTDFWIYPESEMKPCNFPATAVLVHIQCDSNLAKMFKASIWPSDLMEIFVDQNPKNFEEWMEGMRVIRDMMYAIRVPVMLSQGTLLGWLRQDGWYRNCDFIPYTTDMDMAFLSDDYTPEIERVFRDHPDFPNPHVYGMPEDAFEFSSWYKDYAANDVFAIYHEGNRSWYGTTNNAQPADLPKHRWYGPAIRDLCTGALRNTLFMVPCNTAEILQAWYGDGWRRPDKNHGTYDFHVHMGNWPNKTRELCERDAMIYCWNGGTERFDGSGCKCPIGFTGKYCRFRVPLENQKTGL